MQTDPRTWINISMKRTERKTAVPAKMQTTRLKHIPHEKKKKEVGPLAFSPKAAIIL